MALLTPPEIVPAIVRVIFDYLTVCKDGIPLVDLEQTISPFGVAPGGPPNFKSSLQAGVEIGLFEQRDDTVSLREVADDMPFRRVLRDKVLAPELNQDLTTDKGSSDLSRALSWFLAQDLYKGVEPWAASGDRGVQKLQAVQFKMSRAIQNDVRWQPFVRWALALGFCSMVPAKKGAVLAADPTYAVIDEVSEVFGSEDSLSIDEFVTRLSQRLPVLDRGTYRTETEAMLTSRPDDQSIISTSLSHCFRRLHVKGVLNLQSMDDAPQAMFSGSDGHREPFSHAGFNDSRAAIEKKAIFR